MTPRLCLIGMLVPAAAFSGLASRLSATGAAPLLRRKSGAAPSTVPVSRLPAVVLSAEPWEATWDPLTGAASIARSGIIEADDDDTCDISKPSACGAPGSVPEWASQLNELQERGPGPSPGPTPTFALTKALLLRIATRILSPGVAAVLTLTLAAALVTEAQGPRRCSRAYPRSVGWAASHSSSPPPSRSRSPTSAPRAAAGSRSGARPFPSPSQATLSRCEAGCARWLGSG